MKPFSCICHATGVLAVLPAFIVGAARGIVSGCDVEGGCVRSVG
ncbi:MAG: hypothetical protein ACYSUC_10150 [Planctomycetota bacterium]